MQLLQFSIAKGHRIGGSAVIFRTKTIRASLAAYYYIFTIGSEVGFQIHDISHRSTGRVAVVVIGAKVSGTSE